MTDEISSVDGFVRWVFETPPSAGNAAFYRGHSKADEYKLVPAVLRTPEAREAEPTKYRDLLIANLSTFAKTEARSTA